MFNFICKVEKAGDLYIKKHLYEGPLFAAWHFEAPYK